MCGVESYRRRTLHRFWAVSCAGCGHVAECRAEADEHETGLKLSHVFGVRAGETPEERVWRRTVAQPVTVPVRVSVAA